MRVRSIAGLVLAAFVMLAAAGAAPSPAAASGTDDETITTVLYPGWNLVGWVGPSTPTSRLFREIPTLQQVSAWDAETQTYRHSQRGRYRNLPTLTLGTGLWLRLDGNTAYSWRRPASGQGVVLNLRRGQNLLGWTGEEGASVADALARFGDDLMEVWHWDAEAQRYVPYPPGSDAARLATLARGQAVRIELAQDRRWWEQGTARPTFVFAEDVTYERRKEVQWLFEHATDVIAMRFGAHTTDYRVEVPADSTIYCSVSQDVTEVQVPACRQSAVAHEYFSVLQNALAAEPDGSYFGPDWLSYGTAEYVQHVYDIESRRTVVNPRPRPAVEKLTRTPDEVHYFHERPFWLTRRTGFIAAEWLADHAGEESLADFYRLGRSHDRWQDAFRLAFRIDLDDFYEALEAYRHERAPVLPHLTDSRIEPVVVSLTDAASQAATEVQDTISGISEFYEDRFGGPAIEYTAYIVDWESFPSTFLIAFQREDKCIIPLVITHSVALVPGCDVKGYSTGTFYEPQGDGYESYLANNHFHGMLSRLAPPSSTLHLRRGDTGVHCIWGIFWLCLGVPEYAALRYDAHTGAADLDDILHEQIRLALNSPKTLDSFENSFSPPEDFPSFWDRRPAIEAEAALFSLAAHWLAEHVGEKSLLEYFRLLPTAQTVDEAFEGAFGLTFEEFYEQFEAYRATPTAE